MIQGSEFAMIRDWTRMLRRARRAAPADGAAAIRDERLGAEHRRFLAALAFDARGLPLSDGTHAGIGGTYHVRRAG